MHPDIIVLAPDRPDFWLIAEIKQQLPDKEKKALEAELREFMLGHACSVGLLVTPAKTWIYQDSFRDYSPASICEVGELDTPEVLGLAAETKTQFELFHALYHWLERMAASWFGALPEATRARESIMQYVVPVISEGRVLAGKAA